MRVFTDFSVQQCNCSVSRLKIQRAAQWQTQLCHPVPRLLVSLRLLYDFGCAFSALVRLRARPSYEKMRCLTLQAPCRICKEKAKASGSAQCKDCKREISSLRYWAKKDNMIQLIDLLLEEPVLCSFLTFVAETRRDRSSTRSKHIPPDCAHASHGAELIGKLRPSRVQPR